jgi:hypothetical protein
LLYLPAASAQINTEHTVQSRHCSFYQVPAETADLNLELLLVK